jgi:hypothetical protein
MQLRSALSGIAKVFNEILGDNYVEGLWQNDLVRGLSWHLPFYECKSPEISHLSTSLHPGPGYPLEKKSANKRTSSSRIA